MANPFTYLELHSTDATRAKSFYAALFGWKTKDTPVPGLGTYTEIDTQEGPGAGLTAHREQGPREVRQRRPAFHGRFDRNEEPQAGPDLSPAALPSDDGPRLRGEDYVLANGLRSIIEDEPSSREVPDTAEQVRRPLPGAQHATDRGIREESPVVV